MTARPIHPHPLALHQTGGNYAGPSILHRYLRWVAASYLILGTIAVAAVAL